MFGLKEDITDSLAGGRGGKSGDKGIESFVALLSVNSYASVTGKLTLSIGIGSTGAKVEGSPCTSSLGEISLIPLIYLRS